MTAVPTTSPPPPPPHFNVTETDKRRPENLYIAVLLWFTLLSHTVSCYSSKYVVTVLSPLNVESSPYVTFLYA